MAFLWLVLVAVVTASNVCRAQIDFETEVDEFVQQVMSCGNIPGLALTLLKDGEVSKTYNTVNLLILRAM